MGQIIVTHKSHPHLKHCPTDWHYTTYYRIGKSKPYPKQSTVTFLKREINFHPKKTNHRDTSIQIKKVCSIEDDSVLESISKKKQPKSKNEFFIDQTCQAF